MKKFVLFMLVLALSLPILAQTESSTTHITLSLVALVLTGFYEVLSRVIPTSKGWSIIGKVLEVLTWLSNLLDRKKSKK